MGQAGRHPHLALVLGRQYFPDPLSIRWRFWANIGNDIKHFTRYHPHQLALRLLGLVMHPTQHMARRLRVVVLYKGHIQARGFFKNAGVETFEEKTALIAKNSGFEQKYMAMAVAVTCISKPSR